MMRVDYTDTSAALCETRHLGFPFSFRLGFECSCPALQGGVCASPLHERTCSVVKRTPVAPPRPQHTQSRGDVVRYAPTRNWRSSIRVGFAAPHTLGLRQLCSRRDPRLAERQTSV